MRSLSRLGPPSGTGRWAPVEPLRRPAVTPTEAATTRALQLLERYGVLTREMALAEGAEGGFAGVYPILKEMEDGARSAAGISWLVSAPPSSRCPAPSTVSETNAEPVSTKTRCLRSRWLPATPLSPTARRCRGRRATAARTELPVPSWFCDPGEPLVHLERGGRSLNLFEGATADTSWVAALAGLVHADQLGTIEVRKVDGEPIADHPDIADLLVAGGFKPGYRGPILRAAR